MIIEYSEKHGDKYDGKTSGEYCCSAFTTSHLKINRYPHSYSTNASIHVQ